MDSELWRSYKQNAFVLSDTSIFFFAIQMLCLDTGRATTVCDLSTLVASNIAIEMTSLWHKTSLLYSSCRISDRTGSITSE